MPVPLSLSARASSRTGVDRPPASPSLSAPPPGGPTVLGLDEAGRGSLVGPLVVGGFLVGSAVAGRLREFGARDSKQLSPARREEVYRLLGTVGQRFWLALDPATVDRHVRRGGLNELEARAFGTLVRRTGASTVYVDACDPVADRFGRAVQHWAGGSAAVIARHRADATIPVVGAASIVAKVHRDRSIRRLQRRLSGDLGSGYPSDPRTCRLVRAVLQDGGPVPPWVRQSWRTMGRLKPPPAARTLETFDP